MRFCRNRRIIAENEERNKKNIPIKFSKVTLEKASKYKQLTHIMSYAFYYIRAASLQEDPKTLQKILYI